jgi:hypothetical protein
MTRIPISSLQKKGKKKRIGPVNLIISFVSGEKSNLSRFGVTLLYSAKPRFPP